MATASSLTLPVPSLTPAEGFHSPPPFPLKSTRSLGLGSSCTPTGKPALDHSSLHNLHAFRVCAAEPNTKVYGDFTYLPSLRANNSKPCLLPREPPHAPIPPLDAFSPSGM